MQEERQIQIKGNQYNNFLDILTEMYNRKQLVLIYTNCVKTQTFSAGIINSVFENEVILNHFLPNGNYDGYAVKQISNIFKIETDSRYSQKITILSSSNSIVHENLSDIEENGFLTLLKFAYKTNKVVSIELYDSGYNDVIGLVKKLDGTLCTISMIDEYGNNDGEAIIDLKDITHIACDGEDEKVIMILHLNLMSKV